MSLFRGMIDLTGQKITIWRATRTAEFTEARNQGRGRDRDIYGAAKFGEYVRHNRKPVHVIATLAQKRDSVTKTETGERRESRYSLKTYEPLFVTDDASADYADIIEASGRLWKVLDVSHDRLGHTWSASLAMFSADETVDKGV